MLGTNCTSLSTLCSVLLRIPRGPDKLGCLQVPQLNTPPTTMVAVLSRSFTQGTLQLTSVWGSPLVSKIQTHSPHPSYPIHHQMLYGLYLYHPEQVQSSYSFPGGSPQTKSRHCPPELCSVHMEATVVCPMQTLLIHRSPPALLSITFLPTANATTPALPPGGLAMSPDVPQIHAHSHSRPAHGVSSSLSHWPRSNSYYQSDQFKTPHPFQR